MSSHESYSTEEILDAIHWCRLGRVRPARDGAFAEAKRLGLLAQDSVWRATERGEGALIVAGRLPGAPAPTRMVLCVMWAVCETYPTPQFVGAWPEWIWEHKDAQDIEDMQDDFRAYGDREPWRFFTTWEYLDHPKVPEPAEAEYVSRQSNSEEVVMAGDGGRVPDVSEQRAEDHVCYIENGRCQFPGCFRRGSADPASVLAALLAESPDATVAAIEALLTSDEAGEAISDFFEGGYRSHWCAEWQAEGRCQLCVDAAQMALSAACRSLLSKAPAGESNEGGNQNDERRH